jgi:molybdopterin converting factor subunit 1
MTVEITAFGIAKDILKQKRLQLEIEQTTVGGLRQQLVKEFPAFDQLKSLKFAVRTDYVDDSFELKENDEVVLIPPVSGG